VQQLRGQLITITNDWGTSYYRCLVVKTSQPTIRVFGAGAIGEMTVAGVVT